MTGNTHQANHNIGTTKLEFQMLRLSQYFLSIILAFITNTVSATDLTEDDFDATVFSIFTELAKPSKIPDTDLEKSIAQADIILCTIDFQGALRDQVFGKNIASLPRASLQARLRKAETASLDGILQRCKGIKMPRALVVLNKISDAIGNPSKGDSKRKDSPKGVDATPVMLDVIEIIPGRSTLEEAKLLQIETGRYEIGGFSINCDIEGDDGILQSLACFTGIPYYSFDQNSKHKQRRVDNNEIHDVLLKGFRNKFGPPQKIQKNIVQNQFGTKFEQHISIWIDKSGNTLTITNINSKVDTGLLLLESKAYLDKKADKQANSNRKF